jgi:endonuclease/exonuclease/phosphatase (EEP) superfamily protein YafD
MWKECHGELALEAAEQISDGSGVGDLLHDAGLGPIEDEIDGGATDCAAQKGFSVARTALAPGVLVDVYNLHGEAGNREPSKAASRAGFEQLATYILEHSAGHAVILGGDTNLHTDRPDRPFDADTWAEFLTATGLADVCGTVDCGTDAGAIDKFAFRSAERLEIIPESHTFERTKFIRESDDAPLSDHDALAVTFGWVATGLG